MLNKIPAKISENRHEMFKYILSCIKYTNFRLNSSVICFSRVNSAGVVLKRFTLSEAKRVFSSIIATNNRAIILKSRCEH